MTDDQQHALQEQRRREADSVELAALRADAERNRWCEEKNADVIYSDCEHLWWVQWINEEGLFCEVPDPDRNAAIDRAMREGK